MSPFGLDHNRSRWVRPGFRLVTCLAREVKTIAPVFADREGTIAGERHLSLSRLTTGSPDAFPLAKCVIGFTWAAGCIYRFQAKIK